MRAPWMMSMGLAIARVSTAATIHVDQATGDDAHDGSSSAQAVKTVTRGLALAAVGDTLDIGPGTYRAGETMPLFVPGAMTLSGAGADQTVLDGANVDQVMQVASTTQAVILRDLAIIRGGSAGGGGIGNGVAFSNVADVLIEGCRLQGNSAGIGAAIFASMSETTPATMTIRGSRFVDNTASIGGGVQFQMNGGGDYALHVSDTTFDGNGGSGAAIGFQENGSGAHALTIDRTRITGSQGSALAVFPNAGSAVIGVTNALIAGGTDAAISVGTRGIAIVNVTLAGNATGISGGSGATIENSILWGNAQQISGAGGTVAHSIVEGLQIDGWSAGSGVTADDPLLDGGYVPTDASPAIDHGSDAEIEATGMLRDLDGGRRAFDFLQLGLPDGVVDLGAFERTRDLIFASGFEFLPVH